MPLIQQIQSTPAQVPAVRIFRSETTQVCMRRSLPESHSSQELTAPPLSCFLGECGIPELFMRGLAACCSRPTPRCTAQIPSETINCSYVACC